jgi:hypothetical protein
MIGLIGGKWGQFRCFLNDAEDHLDGRLYTWGDECEHPTLERIDRAFISMDREFLFSSHELQALPSLCSDHAPLLLQTSTTTSHRRIFHFLLL